MQNQVAMVSIQATLAEPGSQSEPARPEGRLAGARPQGGDGVSIVVAGAIVALGYLLAPALPVFVACASIRRVRRWVV